MAYEPRSNSMPRRQMAVHFWGFCPLLQLSEKGRRCLSDRYWTNLPTPLFRWRQCAPLCSASIRHAVRKLEDDIDLNPVPTPHSSHSAEESSGTRCLYHSHLPNCTCSEARVFDKRPYRWRWMSLKLKNVGRYAHPSMLLDFPSMLISQFCWLNKAARSDRYVRNQPVAHKDFYSLTLAPVKVAHQIWADVFWNRNLIFGLLEEMFDQLCSHHICSHPLRNSDSLQSPLCP